MATSAPVVIYFMYQGKEEAVEFDDDDNIEVVRSKYLVYRPPVPPSCFVHLFHSPVRPLVRPLVRTQSIWQARRA